MNTKFRDIDRLIGGLEKEELIILGGRPAMGKTSLAIDIARNSGKKVLYIALEQLSNHHIEKITSASVFIHEYYFTVGKIRKLAKSLKVPIDFIVVDYIQLLDTGNPIKELKQLAQELELPILALSQLRRIVEGRKNRRPMINDLGLRKREQASYADKILFLYRDGYYTPEADEDIAEIIIARNAGGSLGVAFLDVERDTHGLYFSDYGCQEETSADSFDDGFGSFKCDLEYAKSLAEVTDRVNVKTAVQQLEELHKRYSEYYEGHMSGIYHACDGVDAIAWEYAKGLLNLASMHYKDYELLKESVVQLKALCDMYDNDVFLTEAYCKGLAYQLHSLCLL